MTPDKAIVTEATPAPQAPRVKLMILAGLLIFHVIFSLFLVVPGYFTVDEGIYHLMAREFAASGGLTVWNGFEEFASEELVLLALRVHGESLVAQYPPLFVMLVSPLYRLAGFHGLFLGNALAFIGVVGLCFLIAQKSFRDLNLSLNACLILILATYSWQYSQAAWPHAMSMVFVAGGFYFFMIALDHPRQGASLALAFLSGLVIGFGTGVRLDVFFVVPALLVLFLFVSPWRPWSVLALCAGLVPGLALLTYLNLSKFGVASPFTYGVSAQTGSPADLATYLELLLPGAIVLVVVWIVNRSRGRDVLLSHRRILGLGLALASAGWLVWPPGLAMVETFVKGAYQLLFDLRIRDLGILEGGLRRGLTGSLVYEDTLKKSLLQSCPYLVVLVLPLLDMVRDKIVRYRLILLFLIPFIYVSVYSYFSWHGGKAFNLRYFLPAMPALAILTAYAWRRMPPLPDGRWRFVCMLAVLLVLSLHFFTIYPHWPSLSRQEAIFLSLPLAIAFGLLSLSLLACFPRLFARSAIGGATAVMMVVALLWAGLVAFSYDYLRDYLVRWLRSGFSARVANVVGPDSIVFARYTTFFFGLIDTERVRFAEPARDNFDDFLPLLSFHLNAGRPVYIWLDDWMREGLEERGILQQLVFVPTEIQTSGTLVRVVQGPGNFE